MKETVKIDPVVLKQQVEDGMKKDALAKHYGISVLQMGKALKAQGLKIRKFHAPAFEFVTAEEVITETVNSEEVIDTNTTVEEETSVNNPEDVVSEDVTWTH